jgi:hypothetical protein
MKKVSILSLLLFTAIIGLACSQFITLRQLKFTRAELDRNRDAHGIFRSADESKISVQQFVNSDYGRSLPKGMKPSESYRIHLPAGSRYVLHLSDQEEANDAYPAKASLVPTETVLLDPWRTEFVLSRVILNTDAGPRLLVSSEADLLFDYTGTNWSGGTQTTSVSWPDLTVAFNAEFDLDERIRLFWWSSGQSARGFMLWLEPEEKWLQRSETATNSSVTTSDLDSGEASEVSSP